MDIREIFIAPVYILSKPLARSLASIQAIKAETCNPRHGRRGRVALPKCRGIRKGAEHATALGREGVGVSGSARYFGEKSSYAIPGMSYDQGIKQVAVVVRKAGRPVMSEFTFKVNLAAVVRVRAGDESVALKIVPMVLGAPGTAEIRLANESNAAKGRHATVIDVDFSIGSVKPLGLVRGRGKSSRA
jgi:hypothetical protein